MYLGFIYGIVEPDTGEEHICLYSRSLNKHDGNLYELKDGEFVLFECDEKKVDIPFAMPIIDFIRFCDLKFPSSLKEVKEELSRDEVRSLYNRCKDNLKDKEEKLIEWDKRSKEGHAYFVDAVQRLKEERDEYLEHYPYLASPPKKKAKGVVDV